MTGVCVYFYYRWQPLNAAGAQVLKPQVRVQGTDKAPGLVRGWSWESLT
jgi:hypothetical protein